MRFCSICSVRSSARPVLRLVTDIMTTMDPQMVSVFTVPMSTADQSVWYATIDLSTVADGLHTIDANAFDSEGVQIDNRPVYGKTFELDRSAPQIDISVEDGRNSAMYMRDDGVLITTGLLTPDPSQIASLMLGASSADSTEDLGRLQVPDYPSTATIRRTDGKYVDAAPGPDDASDA